MFRVGFGQDSHPFTEDVTKSLMLGGIVIENHWGFKGNSDGDVVLHALCDAIEQSIGSDSFARYADVMCKEQGITDSAQYVVVALQHLEEAGFALNNVGVSIECKTPKIMPHVDRMKERIAEILGVERSLIGINATSGDRLSAVACGGGVTAHVVVSVVRKQ